MSSEFERIVIEKLDTMQKDIGTLQTKIEVIQKDFNEKNSILQNYINILQKDSDIMKNVNIPKILEQQIKNNEEQNNNFRKILNMKEKYEKINEKEHKLLKYEINNLKTYVI